MTNTPEVKYNFHGQLLENNRPVLTGGIDPNAFDVEIQTVEEHPHGELIFVDSTSSGVLKPFLKLYLQRGEQGKPGENGKAPSEAEIKNWASDIISNILSNVLNSEPHQVEWDETEPEASENTLTITTEEKEGYPSMDIKVRLQRPYIAISANDPITYEETTKEDFNINSLIELTWGKKEGDGSDNKSDLIAKITPVAGPRGGTDLINSTTLATPDFLSDPEGGKLPYLPTGAVEEIKESSSSEGIEEASSSEGTKDRKISLNFNIPEKYLYLKPEIDLDITDPSLDWESDQSPKKLEDLYSLDENNNKTYLYGYSGTYSIPLPQIPTSKITGLLDNDFKIKQDLIPNISTDKLEGTVKDNQIDTISTNKLVGTVKNDQIENLSADKITSGNVALERLPQEIQDSFNEDGKIEKSRLPELNSQDINYEYEYKVIKDTIRLVNAEGWQYELEETSDNYIITLKSWTPSLGQLEKYGDIWTFEIVNKSNSLLDSFTVLKADGQKEYILSQKPQYQLVFTKNPILSDDVDIDLPITTDTTRFFNLNIYYYPENSHILQSVYSRFYFYAKYYVEKRSLYDKIEEQQNQIEQLTNTLEQLQEQVNKLIVISDESKDVSPDDTKIWIHT